MSSEIVTRISSVIDRVGIPQDYDLVVTFDDAVTILSYQSVIEVDNIFTVRFWNEWVKNSPPEKIERYLQTNMNAWLEKH